MQASNFVQIVLVEYMPLGRFVKKFRSNRSFDAIEYRC